MNPIDYEPVPLPLLAGMAFRLTDPVLVCSERPATDGSQNECTRLRGLLERDPPGFDRVVADDAVHSVLHHVPIALRGLECLDNHLIAIEGGKPCARPGPAWDLVSRIVDPEILVAHQLARIAPWREGDFDVLRLAWPPLLRAGRGPFDALLFRRMTETHLHLGGALPPSLLWILVLAQLRRPSDILPLHVTESGASRQWQQSLLHAAAALAAIYDCLFVCPAGRLNPSGLPFCLQRSHASPPAQGILCPQEHDNGLADGTALLDRLVRLVPFDDPSTFDGPALWPLGPATTCRSGLLATLIPERRLLWQGFSVVQHSMFEHPVARALETYVLVKNAFHHTLIHHRGSRGLARFMESFKRQYRFFAVRSWDRRPDRRWKANIAFERQRVAQTLESFLWDAVGELPGPLSRQMPSLDLELRVRLESGRAFWANLVAWGQGIRDVLRRTPNAPLRVGFVFHFMRTSDDHGLDGSAEWQADGLLAVLRDEPALRPLIVGLDVAGDELDAPPRAHATLYHRIRRALNDQRPSEGPHRIRLGLTYHVGEDFRDLLTGLRHIDEAAHLLALLPGDRLGHALALAWHPHQFYERRGGVYPRRREHILDLLWSWRLLEGEREPLRALAVRARDWLCEILSRAAVDQVPDRLEQARRLLDRERPSLAPSDSTDAPVPVTEEDLLAALAFDQGWQDDLLSPLPDNRKEWIRLVEAVQRVVRRRVLGKNLVLEVCPTSNLIIGGFRSYRELPYLRLNRHGLARGRHRRPDLPVSLNTDDPGLFNTTLRNEYQQMGQALLERGFPLRAVVAWLDEARLVGVDSTFIPPWAPSGRQLLRYLDRLLSPSLRSPSFS